MLQKRQIVKEREGVAETGERVNDEAGGKRKKENMRAFIRSSELTSNVSAYPGVAPATGDQT